MEVPHPLGKISVRGFAPGTYGRDPLRKKKELRDKFLLQNNNLDDIREKCKGKRLSIEVRFYLFRGSSERGRAEKDLDNLLKIVFDVLPEHMDRNKQEKGLGVIEKDGDHQIFEVHAVKELVDEPGEEGIDLTFNSFTHSTPTRPSS